MQQRRGFACDAYRLSVAVIDFVNVAALDSRAQPFFIFGTKVKRSVENRAPVALPFVQRYGTDGVEHKAGFGERFFLWAGKEKGDGSYREKRQNSA